MMTTKAMAVAHTAWLMIEADLHRRLVRRRLHLLDEPLDAGEQRVAPGVAHPGARRDDA
jgi:hypothetical protein